MADNNGAFPKLVMDISPATQRAAPSVASPLAQRVENRLREVLAWRPRSGDARSFVAALNQAFTIRDVAGHTEWEWTPRSYAIQADMGAVTGAQASIYARARAALDQSRPLIEAVYPLRSDADKEDAESIRTLVLAQWQELVSELGRVGGPRLQRIEGLFDSLLGKDFAVDDNHETVGGLLGVMRERFGFDEDRVNRIDEEQNWTNYLILVDHTIGLKRSWTTLQRYFDNTGTDVFLGTQLVLLSRALDVITESVHSARILMDSVFLSEGEQQIVRLNSGLTIDDLLAWIESFCSQEAKQIIRDAGKDGVVALQPTLDTLLDLVGNARMQAEGDAENPQPGFHTLRVKNALLELEQHITQAAELASQIRRGALRVTGVFPATIDVTERKPVLNITVDGTGFEPGATVRLIKLNGEEKVVTVEQVLVLSKTRLLMILDTQVLASLNAGEWSLIVINPDSEESDPYDIDIRAGRGEPPAVERKVVILTVKPDHGGPGDKLGVDVFGMGFEQGMHADFGAGIITRATEFVDENTLKVTLAIDGSAAPGLRDVAVWPSTTRPSAGHFPSAQAVVGGPLAVLTNGFTVDEPDKGEPPGARKLVLTEARLLNRTAKQPESAVKAVWQDLSSDEPRVSKSDGVDGIELVFSRNLDSEIKWNEAVEVWKEGVPHALSVTPMLAAPENTVTLATSNNFSPGTYKVALDPEQIKATDGSVLAEAVSLTFHISSR